MFSGLSGLCSLCSPNYSTILEKRELSLQVPHTSTPIVQINLKKQSHESFSISRSLALRPSTPKFERQRMAINKNRKMIKQFYRFLVFLISFRRRALNCWIQKSSIISMVRCVPRASLLLGKFHQSTRRFTAVDRSLLPIVLIVPSDSTIKLASVKLLWWCEWPPLGH